MQQIVLATSTYEVEHLIAAEVTGDLALVSLGFGSATNRIVGLLRPLWNRITLVTEGPTTEEHLAAGIRAGATGVLHHRQRRRVDAHLATVLGADLDIIDLIAQGCGNKEIALRLSIPEMQVKGRLGRLSRRIGIGDRAGLVAVAYRMGLIGDTTQAPSPLTPR